jgi:hypothetical protein
MDRVLIRKLTSVCVVASLCLAACGGGGGDGGGTTPPPPSGNITVSGTVTFDRPTYTTTNRLNFSITERLPVRGATVELLRASDQAILVTTTTDGTTGNYSASIANTPFIVRIKAQLAKAGTGGYDFEVRNNTSGNALYTLDSSTVTPSNSAPRVDLNAPTGWSTATSSFTGTRASGPFAILDILWNARTMLQAAEPSLGLPALDVYWSVLNSGAECGDGQPDPDSGAIGTTFYVGGTIPASGSCSVTLPGIYVLGESSDADEFDPSVIAHELGHYFQDKFSRDESMGGPHTLGDRHDPMLAFSEGWGNAFQGFVLDNPLYRDTFGLGGTSTPFTFDMENNSAPYQTLAEEGFFAEASVHEFLWDVYDGVGEDAIDLGYLAVHTVMRVDMGTNELFTTAALTSIFAFSSALETRYPAQQAAIRNQLVTESITGIGEFGAGQTLPDDPDLVPVFEPVSLDAPPKNVTSTNRYAFDAFFQSYNTLGARRYLRIELPTGGNLNVAVQGPVGSDPDLFLYRNGVDQCPSGGACSGFDDSVATGREEASFSSLAAGTYVLELFECSFLGQLCREPVFPTDVLFDVTVTR